MSLNNVVPAWMLGSPNEICSRIGHNPKLVLESFYECQRCNRPITNAAARMDIARRQAMGADD